MKKRKKGSNFWVVSVLIIALGVYSARSYLFSLDVVHRVSSYLMHPLLVAQNALVSPIKKYFEKKRANQELEALVAVLQSECQDLTQQNIQLNGMLSYVRETDELVSFKQQYHVKKSILVQVLARNFSEQGHYYFIDKGAQAGVQENMVAVYKNCLIGKVVDVFPYYSKVLLITDKSCKVASYCAHTQSTGIHEGCNKESETGMRYVTHLTQIDSDDLVLSSGQGLVFPKGFALGKIKTCHPDGLFYDVAVEPLLDMRHVEYCYIIQKGLSDEQTLHESYIQQVAENVSVAVPDTAA